MTAVHRHVDALARELLGPMLEAPESPSRWRIVGWDAEQGITLTLGRGDDLLLIELQGRDARRDCYARTERFNVCARRAFCAEPLGDRERAVVDRVVDVVSGRERRLPIVPRPTTSQRAAVRQILVDRVLVPEGRGHYYVNPYVGCMVGCEFCYVADQGDVSRALEGLPRLPWGRWADVKVNAAEVLAREVRRAPPGPVRMSPVVTDPYQPLERRFRITRSCLEVLLGAGFSPCVLTRAERVVDDLPLLRRFERAAVGFSIPTDDDHVRQAFEPGADPIENRLGALRACHQAGLLTFAVVQPVLPMSVERLVDAVAPHVRAVRIDRMHAMSRAAGLYDAAGLEHARTDAFFDAMVAELRERFEDRGVPVDDLDDLAGLLGLG